ncbi:pilin [Patescibacteria group bacterium]|nr:pilin [Patescibacteria group bacterium]
MNKSKKIVSFAILLVMAAFQMSFMSNVHQVIAGPLNLNNQEGMAPGSGQIDSAFGTNPNKDVREIIVSYVKIFLGLLGLIFVILIILAGYKYMMAGDNKVTEEALSQIKNAVIGLAIILAAYGVTIFVGNQINTATSSTTLIDSAFFDIFYV